MVSCIFCQSPQLQVENNWTGLNVHCTVKLLDTCILLFWIRVILVSTKKSWRRFCMLHKIFIRPAVCQVALTDVQKTIRQRVAVLLVLGYWSELWSYWLSQNSCCLWLDALKTTLSWLERLAESLGTKLIGLLQAYWRDFSIYWKEDVLFQLKSEVPPKN